MFCPWLLLRYLVPSYYVARTPRLALPISSGCALPNGRSIPDSPAVHRNAHWSEHTTNRIHPAVRGISLYGWTGSPATAARNGAPNRTTGSTTSSERPGWLIRGNVWWIAAAVAPTAASTTSTVPIPAYGHVWPSRTSVRQDGSNDDERTGFTCTANFGSTAASEQPCASTFCSLEFVCLGT